jgi:hypothetical protein
MPKTKLDSLPPDDVPVWDTLVAELGDPRPYEPTEIGTITITDEPCVDDAGFDDVSTDLDDEVERFWHYADELTFDASNALDDLVTEFRIKHDIVVLDPIVTSTVDDATLMVPALGTLDQLNNPIDQTQELPRWPSSS